jgi:hypothetical protein
MKNMSGYVAAATVCLCCSLLAAPVVFARTRHATAGHPSSIAAASCWDSSGAFMTNVCPTTQGWVISIPMPEQTAGAGGTGVGFAGSGGGASTPVTVTLIGQVLSGGSAQCNLSAFTSAGVQAGGFPVSFPTFTSSVGPVTVSVLVDPSATLLVGCSASGNAKVRLLGVDHT